METHQAYLMEIFDVAHVYGAMDYFSPLWNEFYCIMAFAQDILLTPAQLIRAHELAEAIVPHWRTRKRGIIRTMLWN